MLKLIAMPEHNLLRRLQSETGSALLASLMMTVLITGAGLAAMTTSAANQNKSTNVLFSKQAAYLAEAGLNHGKLLLHQNINNWSTYAAYTTAQSFVSSTPLAGVGSYAVTIKGVSGGVLLTATGTGPKSAQESISTLATLENGNTMGKAFITGQSLLISGSPTFTGTSGGIHANGNLTISGNPVISSGTAVKLDAEAAGTYTVTGSPTITGYAGGNQPQQTINSLSASQLSSAYDYYFTYCYNPGDGTYHGCVYDRSWNLKADVANDNTASFDGNDCWEFTTYSYSGGWSWSSRSWSWVYTPYTYTPFKWTATCKPLNATYYVIGDVVIEGDDIGTSANPWITTILTYGSIKVESDELVIRPPVASDGSLYKSQTQNLLFVANMDVRIKGKADQYFTGITSAYGQVGISGNPNYYGYILAQDVSNQATSYYGTNEVASNYISGDMRLTYNGDLSNSRQGNAVFQATLY